MSNPNNPELLTVVTLTNKSKPAKLEAYQGILTEMSANNNLKDIMLTIPSNVDNRGLNSGSYLLVNILKTLGNDIVIDDAKNKTLAANAAKNILNRMDSSNKNETDSSIFSTMLEIEDMHSASIRIESEKKSAFIKGFYLLRPLLEVLHNASLNLAKEV